MKTFTPSELIDALRHRYATKIFDAGRPLPADVLEALERALVLSPSAFGLQPWKFIVIRDRALREKLLPHTWNQPQVVDCSHLVVFARRDHTGAAEIDAHIRNLAVTRGVDPASLNPYKERMSAYVLNHRDIARWASDQVYIALGQFLASCAALGVDACPIEGIIPAKYDEILGLEGTGYSTVVTCPVGYRSASDKYAALAKVRKPASEVIEHR